MTTTLSQRADTLTHAQTMRAAVITAPHHVDLVDVAIPTPAPNQVLIKLEGCGVCSSNIPPWEGRDWFHYSFTLNHLADALDMTRYRPEGFMKALIVFSDQSP